LIPVKVAMRPIWQGRDIDSSQRAAMPILILYATTEGQTRKIARRAAAHLTQKGHSVELISAAESGQIDPRLYDRAILMASVHAGRYQDDFNSAVIRNTEALARLPAAFVSVSLSAASDDPEDHEGIAACVRKMQDETGWTPQHVEHVAGAFRFTRYDFLKSWAMRWIAAKRDPGVSTSSDTEYTDWDALYRFLDSWTTLARTA
jgi:menaquinone-dependent protoporphyrinogen oxidase